MRSYIHGGKQNHIVQKTRGEQRRSMRIQDQSHFCSGAFARVLNVTSPLPLPAYQMISWSISCWCAGTSLSCFSSLGFWASGGAKDLLSWALCSALLQPAFLPLVSANTRLTLLDIYDLRCFVTWYIITLLEKPPHFNAHSPYQAETPMY